MPASTSPAPTTNNGERANEGGDQPFEFPLDEITEGITICHREDAHQVYGGRGRNGRNVRTTRPGTRGWLGNPHKLTENTDRATVIAQFVPAFYGRLRSDPESRAALLDLPGKRVACWCRHADEDRPHCHLDVIDHFLRGGRMFVREFLRHDLRRDLRREDDGTVTVVTAP